MPTLLIASEEPLLADFLTENFEADGFDVLASFDLASTQVVLRRHAVHLVLVDLNGMSLSLLDAIRSGQCVGQTAAQVPVLWLTSNRDSVERIRAFDRGCDHLVTKPCGYPELLARCRAVLRRAFKPESPSLIVLGSLRVQPDTRLVELDGQRVELTAKEWQLLMLLIKEPDRVFTKAELHRMVWGWDEARPTRTLDSHMCRLRRKLAGTDEQWVQNIWGVGFRLTFPSAALTAA